MDKLLKLRQFVLSSALIFLISSVFMLNQSCSSDESVKIGVIISSSGSGAHMSETIDGIKLAAAEVNKWGGINGKEVELLIRDNETNPQKAVEIFKELEAEYSPELYLCALSSISQVLAPLAEEYRVPLIGLVTTTDITKDKDWVFRFYNTAESEIPPVMHFINKLNIKTMSVFFRDDVFGNFVLANLIERNEEQGINIRSAAFDPKTSEITDNLGILDDLDAAYIIGFATDIGKILKQLREADYPGYIIGSSGASQDATRRLPEADGVYLAAPPIYNENYPFAAELKKNFEEDFNRTLNHYGANGYESIKYLHPL